MKVVVVGSSAAGQFTALLLARSGHEVLLLDRDGLPTPSDADEAAETAYRPTAPHLVQPHALLPRCRLLLREHLTDVYEALLAAGAREATLEVGTPPGVQLEAQPGDEDFTSIATRRSTLDFVLRRAVSEEPGITCRFGVRTDGLLAVDGSPPQVTGVRTDTGDVAADLVVDASGRRTRVDSWLTEIGAASTQLIEAECGLGYYSRHYRVRDGHVLPGHPAARVLLALDEFTTGLWNGDNGTATIAVSPLVEDHRFRSVKDPQVFDAVVRSVPAYRPWLDALEPTSGVFVMAGLHNTWRRLIVDGRPCATGLALVGDSRCPTNPTFGRGLSLALIEAADLVTAIVTSGGDPLKLAYAAEGLAAAHVEPFYVDQAHNDAMRLAALRHAIFDVPVMTPPRSKDRVSFAELRQAVPLHADVVRAFWRVMGMLDLPEAVYCDPHVVRVTRELLGTGEPPTMPQPTRAEIETALAEVTGLAPVS